MSEVASVNVGRSSALSYGGERIRTGIFKDTVDSAYLTETGFRGDVQVDRDNHGGRDKAVCVYSVEHLDHWSRDLGTLVGPGAFGENLTVTESYESDVCIGDVFTIGQAEVEVSQPRQPCHKLSKKMGDLDFAARVIELGFTGYYVRVLREGVIARGDTITRIRRSPGCCTIDMANRAMYGKGSNRSALAELIDAPALSEAWRSKLGAREQNS